MKPIAKYPTAILVLSMFALLIATMVVDQWLAALKENFEQTFSHQSIYLRLWSVPITSLLLAICLLFLFRYFLKHKNKFVFILFIVVGMCIIFYPTIAMTFGVVSVLRISVDYIGDTLLFYAGAFIAAMGIFGLRNSKET